MFVSLCTRIYLYKTLERERETRITITTTTKKDLHQSEANGHLNEALFWFYVIIFHHLCRSLGIIFLALSLLASPTHLQRYIIFKCDKHTAFVSV